MTDSPIAARALSFGAVADSYDRYRPAPPGEAVDWVLPTSAVDVLDLGAGTGAVTRLLRERVPGKVVAAEPDGRMRAVLVRRVPDVLAVGARAEALPFAGATFDAVAVSSAWHWMDLALTVPEAARVLRPGGRLGVLWNGPARDVEWVAELLGPRRERVGPASDHANRHRVELPPDAPFTTPETTVITWSMPMTRDELVGLAGTYSAVITRPAEERAEILRRVERLATDHAGFGSGTTVQLPMRCRCWRATRS
jgi:SAM-dependent methyltransferase